MYDLDAPGQGRGIAAVLLLIGWSHGRDHGGPYFILNKRSAHVRQAGDICCPGGGVERRIDGLFSRLLMCPRTPLTRWPLWKALRRRAPRVAAGISLLLATGLRESLEEMRLNPFGVTLLGPLHPQQLVMFQQTIYPFVCLVGRQQRFFPNWEVEKVARLPVSSLLNPNGYRKLRLALEISSQSGAAHPGVREFPCFTWNPGGGEEVLWGATFRIITQYLQRLFGFTPPAMPGLPLIKASKDASYLFGRKRSPLGGA